MVFYCFCILDARKKYILLSFQIEVARDINKWKFTKENLAFLPYYMEMHFDIFYSVPLKCNLVLFDAFVFKKRKTELVLSNNIDFSLY